MTETPYPMKGRNATDEHENQIVSAAPDSQVLVLPSAAPLLRV